MNFLSFYSKTGKEYEYPKLCPQTTRHLSAPDIVPKPTRGMNACLFPNLQVSLNFVPKPTKSMNFAVLDPLTIG